jgi:hypothetical protein
VEIICPAREDGVKELARLAKERPSS